MFKKIISYMLVIVTLSSFFVGTTVNVYAKDKIDIENLKYRVASDKKLISVLAELADMMGYGWCGGTRSNNIGEDFDVYKEGNDYVMRAHYNGNDRYSKGYRRQDTLKINYTPDIIYSCNSKSNNPIKS